MKKQENRLSIGTINGVDIYAFPDENNLALVPIRPICEAIGVDYKAQYSKVKEDEILSSTMVLSTTVAADGKDRDMVCLPLEYIYGWIFSINPRNVNPQAKDSVAKYKHECYDVLYRHFFNRVQRQTESNKAEAAELEHLRQLIEQQNLVKADISDTKKRIDAIRAARLDDQPSLFD